VNGSFALAGGRIQVLAQVLDIEGGTVLKAVKETGAESEIFDLVDAVSAGIRTNLDKLLSERLGNRVEIASLPGGIASRLVMTRDKSGSGFGAGGNAPTALVRRASTNQQAAAGGIATFPVEMEDAIPAAAAEAPAEKKLLGTEAGEDANANQLRDRGLAEKAEARQESEAARPTQALAKGQAAGPGAVAAQEPLGESQMAKAPAKPTAFVGAPKADKAFDENGPATEQLAAERKDSTVLEKAKRELALPPAPASTAPEMAQKGAPQYEYKKQIDAAVARPGADGAGARGADLKMQQAQSSALIEAVKALYQARLLLEKDNTPETAKVALELLNKAKNLAPDLVGVDTTIIECEKRLENPQGF
jgi:hypothetical protein